jgi:flagellar biogenesis protein FliO
MWSIGGAVLLVILLCIVVIAWAMRRLLAEVEPTRGSCERLQREVADAVQVVSRDAGRATAGRQLLARRGSTPASR